MNLTPLNITRIKSVTNVIDGKAYLDIKDSEFILHWPDTRKGNISDVKKNEIIILFQKIKGILYLTHMVIPQDDIRIEEDNRENYRFGRKVQILGCTGEENLIRFDQTSLRELNFRNRGWGSADLIEKIANNENIEKYQLDLWNLFRPFFIDEVLMNDKTLLSTINEIDSDSEYSANEGELKLVNHLIRERDKKIIIQKKSEARKNGMLFCEVCEFSFQTVYSEDYIECHHKIAINEGVRETRKEDLSLVCANCHRMLHRKIEDKYLSIEELRQKIKNKA